MDIFEMIMIPLSAGLEWWTQFWSREQIFLNVFLSLIFVRLLFVFILDPLMKGDAGSDRADQHPKRK